MASCRGSEIGLFFRKRRISECQAFKTSRHSSEAVFLIRSLEEQGLTVWTPLSIGFVHTASLTQVRPHQIHSRTPDALLRRPLGRSQKTPLGTSGITPVLTNPFLSLSAYLSQAHRCHLSCTNPHVTHTPCLLHEAISLQGPSLLDNLLPARPLLSNSSQYSQNLGQSGLGPQEELNMPVE